MKKLFVAFAVAGLAFGSIANEYEPIESEELDLQQVEQQAAEEVISNDVNQAEEERTVTELDRDIERTLDRMMQEITQ